jgi:hypothetical protein
LKYEVRKGADLIDDEESPEIVLIYVIGVVKGKVPIKEECIPKPTFSIVC